MTENERKLLILVAKIILGGTSVADENLEELTDLINKAEAEVGQIVPA